MLILMNVETADLTGEEMKQMLQSNADGARTRIFHALYATPELDQKIYLDKTPSNFVFGADGNEAVIQTCAAAWNNHLKTKFLEAAEGVLHISQNGGMPTEADFKPDEDALQKLQLASMMLRNRWSISSPYAVFRDSVMGYPYLCTMLRDDDLQSITDHPEDWVFVTVSPKI